MSLRRRNTKRLSYIEQRGWLLVGKKPGLLSLNRSKKVWNEAWGEMKKNLLHLSKDEETSKRNKHFKVINIQNCEFFDATKRKKTPCCIRVIPKEPLKGKVQPPFYIQGENLKSIDELKLDLELNGGKFMGSYGQTEGGTRLEKTTVADWKVPEVMEWLRIIGFTKYQKTLKENKISGAMLVELDATLLENSYQIESEDAELMENQINLLKKFKMFSLKRSVVQHKFRSFPTLDKEEEGLPEVVDSLSDEAKIKHKFLSTADLRSHTLMSTKLTKAEAEQARVQVNEEQLLQFEKFDTAKINIKLVVTEVHQSSRTRKLKKVVSPVISAVMPNLSKKFQFFHTAIIVGPWYLEWTDSELIIPKRMVAGRAVISADVETLIVKKQGLKEIADKISEVVVRWNTRYKYGKKSGGSVRDKELMQGNCQEFVDDVLKALGIQQDFNGALGEFIQRMRVTGKCALEFTPCKEFKDFFDLEKKTLYYDTHAELDEFCVRVKTECVDVEDLFPSEWSLLKSFDRAFWLRYLKDQADERYKPIPPTEEDDDGSEFCTGCPFKDPRLTLSYC